jgi:hypothetical protein
VGELAGEGQRSGAARPAPDDERFLDPVPELWGTMGSILKIHTNGPSGVAWDSWKRLISSEQRNADGTKHANVAPSEGDLAPPAQMETQYGACLSTKWDWSRLS